MSGSFRPQGFRISFGHHYHQQLEAFEMWVWRRIERVKWTDKIKNAVVLERVGEGRIRTDKEGKR